MLGVGNYLSKFLKKPLKYIYNVPSIGGYIFALSLLSGYPVGAKLVADYARFGIIDKEDARAIISFASTSGPMFILGTVGVQMLGDYKAGLMIFCGHVIAAIINGLLFRSKGLEREELVYMNDVANRESMFNDALQSSIASIILVGANIVILNVFLIALKRLGVIGLLTKGLVLLGINQELSMGVAVGLIEITQGISCLSNSIQEIKDIIIVSSVIISFGGASVMMQSMSFLSQAGVKTSYYLVTKISHAIIAYAVTSVIVLFY